MGDAICRDAQKLRDIVDAIYDDQRLQPRASKPSVREEHAAYCVPAAPLLREGVSPAMPTSLTYH